MKITEVKLLTLQREERPVGLPKLIQMPGLRRIQYRQRGVLTGEVRPVRYSFLKVATDEGIDSICTCYGGPSPEQVEILRHNVVGENPLHREALYQKLHKGTRWIYQAPGWFGNFDNCLWDIAGKAAGLPVCALIGKVRDRLPAYLTGDDCTLEGYLEEIESGRQYGINAYKIHSYKGGKADLSILRALRAHVGPDYVLIHDPVCSYDLREAIEVGHLLEELGFVWLEEPFHEQKMNLYQELCRELTILVMATERLMYDIDLSAQWLIHGATDRLRANARHGTTQVLKLAHFAELHGAHVELNHQGGLYGLIHAHLGCCIDNTDFYEHFSRGRDALANRHQGLNWGLLNGPLIVEGHIAPPDGPGWGAEWDMDKFQSMVVAEQ
jgi:L-alanine-DL-glutamate epimerase-like enolase superfamily enzyme